MRFRQVHLDFHTTEHIMNIGAKFNKRQFQEMLQLGHVDSVTVFSKCHHGWAYHPSEANEMHPHLSFDLLGAMIEAAHEIGVKTPVYLSAGLDEKLARSHPEWLYRDKNDRTIWADGFMMPGYHELCMNSPYLDMLVEQVKEVAARYQVDGLFLDIVSKKSCYCHNCVNAIRQQGHDPRDKQAMEALWERTYSNYTSRINEAAHAIKPGIPIFHNGGHITRGRRDLAFMNTHLELESLPTGGWGYDHFPLSARYAQQLGLDFLGMTGKFHTTWGEFGGYKHPNALRYEAALSMANGARCSIGDQLHPEGLMDEATYGLIGVAYGEVAEKEPWCTDTGNIADVALLTLEAVGMHRSGEETLRISKSDVGVVRMLLEGHILFDVVDLDSNFDSYKVIILPDKVFINEQLQDKLNAYIQKGGKIFATGQSGLNENGDAFAIDLGVRWIGENPYKPDYFKPQFKLNSLGNASFIQYSQGQKIELAGGIELGQRQDPYFNRDIFTFCSHQHTPNSETYGGPGLVEGSGGIYMAWNVFDDYAVKGSLTLKETVLYALNRLLEDRKTLDTDLPAQGVVTLQRQQSANRYVNHLLYASPVNRGEQIEIIEDIIPLYDIDVTLRLTEPIKRAYLAPQQQEIPFQQTEDTIRYTLPRLECHQMVVLEY